jgi:hypothetical protein
MKTKMSIVVLFVTGLAIILFVVARNTSVTLSASASVMKFSLDDMIKEADLIVIGEVKTTLPSQWRGPNGNNPSNASPEEVSDARGLFTDSLISVNQVLKGDNVKPIVRVRTFIGETKKVRWVNESEPSYVVKKNYLLFLAKDIGASAKIGPGDYVAVGAFQGVYEIVNGKAISKTGEWDIDELIAYIQKSLSDEASSPKLIPTPTELLIETLTPSPASADLPTQTPLPTETVSPTP